VSAEVAGKPLNRDALAAVSVLAWIGSSVLSLMVGLWLAVGGAAVLLGTLLLLTRAVDREQLRLTRSGLAWGLAAGGVMTAATYLLFPPARQLVPEVVTQTAALYATFGEAAGWRAILVLPLVITGEELVWRGVVQGALVRRFGVAGGIALTTFAYTLAVAPAGSALLLVIAISCGLYWSVLRARTGRLAPVLVCHLLWDLFVFVLAPLGSAR
jgi:uncharacterized protein